MRKERIIVPIPPPNIYGRFFTICYSGFGMSEPDIRGMPGDTVLHRCGDHDLEIVFTDGSSLKEIEKS